ncbi:amino acid ABC transporter permease [Desulfoscipio geothermicus]|uniref:Amino acid ABC transporter membrane protein, PAAT family n=1 Tax=Desulfoscipio geothermicus DSM 3669 TaxID=1121426 RepID=A0A1I6DJ68_9FIRM|nr:amino acid ABC transporter membrane protein, PAAT family [Desulfoscipio geothermicus DSM 3669]
MTAIYEIFMENAAAFMQATTVTLKLTFVSLLLAMLIGLVFAFFKISGNRVLYGIAQLYITVIRGTPLIVQLMFLYFGIIKIVVLPAFWAGSLALAIHAGAYIAEIFRGTIQSIDRGQMEAARSLGMSYPLAMRRIILPQAFKRAIPPLGNQFIIGLKDSSLVAYLGVAEIYGTALYAQAENFQPFETYLVAGFYYLVLVIIFTFLVNKLELKLNVENGGDAK